MTKMMTCPLKVLTSAKLGQGYLGGNMLQKEVLMIDNEKLRNLFLSAYQTTNHDEIIARRPDPKGDQLLGDEYNAYLSGLFWNPYILNSEYPLSKFFHQAATRLVMSHSAISEKGVRKLTEDEKVFVRAEVLLRPEPLPDDILEKYYVEAVVTRGAGSEHIGIRLAKREDLSYRLALKLTQTSTSSKTLKAIANNMSIPDEIRITAGLASTNVEF